MRESSTVVGEGVEGSLERSSPIPRCIGSSCRHRFGYSFKRTGWERGGWKKPRMTSRERFQGFSRCARRTLVSIFMRVKVMQL